MRALPVLEWTYLQVTPMPLGVQLGAGGGPGKVASPHCPVAATAASNVTSKDTGKLSSPISWYGARPRIFTLTAAGALPLLVTVTRSMPG